jgi:flavin reductase (DIM6/NTAB) family NADH-FMN oxidoreductase RutF
LSFLTTQEVVGVVVVEGVVVALEALIWSVMSVVSLVILLVNAVCVLVQEDVVVALPLDIEGAQVMVEGNVR